MTLKLSHLARRVGHSGTLAIEDRMLQLRAEGKDIVNLGVGQLDFDTPEAVRAAGVAAIEQGMTRYTPAAGTEALLRAVRVKFERENGLEYGADEVIVGSGAKSVLFHGLLALLDPEDAVIVPVPAWPSYRSMIAVAGGQMVAARLDARNGYKLTADGLVEAVRAARGRAHGLVLNAPHNPTGAVYAREELAQIAEVVQGEGLWVISDEIYEHLIYEGSATSFAAIAGMRARTLTVNGVSKSFAMTGWRIGYGGGPAALVRCMVAIQSHTSGNACSISQHAAEAALRLTLEGDEALSAERQRVHDAMLRRRDLACRELAAIPGVTLVRPAGAFYIFADFSSHYGRELGGERVLGSSDLAAYLLSAAGVSVVPGIIFGDDRGLRLSFATAREELSVALQRIKKALA
ncbi:MAG TPA: pyridoxal phosphate-dependent aminotransferase [Candidatus Limnocylindria bacterium]|nr:pyridoxal phosphate-dependent aminotransferase [Candidatus Limnocylindria bacterium]